jgi:hypothetical protein
MGSRHHGFPTLRAHAERMARRPSHTLAYGACEPGVFTLAADDDNGGFRFVAADAVAGAAAGTAASLPATPL